MTCAGRSIRKKFKQAKGATGNQADRLGITPYFALANHRKFYFKILTFCLKDPWIENHA